MINIKSLRIDYDNVTAVQDLDLTIAQGEVYGLVGPNGAGKTSTIKALAGILEPTYGEIKIKNVDLEHHPQQALRFVGYMPDFPPVYENLKVWEYLDIFGMAYQIPPLERSKKLKYWIERVDLTSKYDAFIHTLSRGMRQRLVLAKTLMHSPHVLLLDEPASGMDPIARMDLRKILKEISQEGTTVIISSHILTELSDFCTSVGIMEKGRLVVSGTISDIRQRMGSKGRLRIRLTDSSEKVRTQLKQELQVSGVVSEITEGSLGIFNGYCNVESPQLSELLKKLITQGYPICDFHLEQENVEDIFFKIGAKEVS